MHCGAGGNDDDDDDDDDDGDECHVVREWRAVTRPPTPPTTSGWPSCSVSRLRCSTSRTRSGPPWREDSSPALAQTVGRDNMYSQSSTGLSLAGKTPVMISEDAKYDDGVVQEQVVEKFVKYFKAVFHHNSWYFAYFISCKSRWSQKLFLKSSFLFQASF